MARLHGGPEIFHSIQGEGPSAGVPCVFARSSLCNLHCVWCDTDYTWNWEGTPYPHERDAEPDYRKYRKADQILAATPADVAARIREFPCRRVVVTGGEPMLQQPAWAEVLRRLRQVDSAYYFEVETNGTLPPSDEFDALIDQYNVSPKLENSGIPRQLRHRDEVLARFGGDARACFKYVVARPEDLAELRRQVEQAGVAADRVYLMPQGRTAPELRDRAAWLAEQCLRHGYRLSDRLHIHLFQDARGR